MFTNRLLQYAACPVGQVEIQRHRWDIVKEASASKPWWWMDIENPSWAPVHGVHPSEFVFQKSRAIASDFCGIQTHEGELYSTRRPWSTLLLLQWFFFHVITSQKHWKSLSNRRKSRSEAGNHSWEWKKGGSLNLVVKRDRCPKKCGRAWHLTQVASN